MELVSVIIPVYNRENTIIRAVSSVLNQTYKHLEVIVVDDCSSDNSVKLLEEINDDRLIVIKSEKNMGACSARNRGIDLATGKYIAFQDSDDEWESTKIEKQLQALEDNAADICFCRARLIKHQSGVMNLVPNILESAFINKLQIQSNSIISTQMIFGKKECFDNIQFDVKLPRMQDYDLVIRLAENYNIFYLSEPLVNIYMQADSISTSSKKMIAACELMLSKYNEDNFLVSNSLYLKANLLDHLLKYEAREGRNDYIVAVELFKCKKNAKSLFKLILCLLHLYSCISMINDKREKNS